MNGLALLLLLRNRLMFKVCNKLRAIRISTKRGLHVINAINNRQNAKENTYTHSSHGIRRITNNWWLLTALCTEALFP